MNFKKTPHLIFFLVFFVAFRTLPAFSASYNLEIKRQDVLITGKAVKAITVNNQIPGPTLKFKEGEEVIINVKNSMNEPTSIHWHGILLPGNMDGVPGLNGFKGIAPGEVFTYHFKIHQAGTYWYHSHSNFQEQQGLYGSIIIEPSNYKSEYDYVILLSDFTEENPKEIMNNLKLDSGYYNYNKRTIFDFFNDIKKDDFWETLKDRMMWSNMRMDPTDLADVTHYHFLVNGKTASQNWTGIFQSGKPAKLRFINAAAMTFFDVSIPGLKMKLVEADGQKIKPVEIDEFRIGPAETYDMMVTPAQNKAYTIFAQSIDRTGYARATLAPKLGMEGEIPQMRARTLLTMADMNMEDMDMSEMSSGWANAFTPQGKKALSYADLISFNPGKDLRQASKEIEFRFGGNMNRYIWTINGQKFPQPIHLKFGERVRLKFINETMMAHPIHLHGMFMQLENGQPLKWMPSKHTVIVPPGQTISTILTVDEEGEWAFHCHLLFHMASGMMTNIVVEKDSHE